MQTSAQILEERTKLYWGVSSVWNGRSNEVVETGDAIEWCSNIAYSMRPELRIRHSAKHLLDAIIDGGGTSIASEEIPNNLVILPIQCQTGRVNAQ